MKSILSGAKDALTIASLAGKTAIYVGDMARRHVTSRINGVCLVCNNLQPHGHEETFGHVGTPFEKRDWADRHELSKTPTLVLKDIKAKEILKARQNDPKTGQPKNDCAYCHLLCEVFDSFFGFVTDKWDSHVMSGLDLSVGLMIRQGQPLIINCYQFEWDPSVYMSRVDLEMYVESEALLSVPGVPMLSTSGVRSSDSSSESCMAFTRACMQECCAKHPRCAQAAHSFVPTRLVSLGDNDNEMRLIETQNTATIQYAALSHCWGTTGTPLKLVRENKAGLESNIAFEKLPMTFRNAVNICRQLSISHLWIDSLCIVQDDGPDWDREAAVMGRIYASAYLVISGTSSGSPDVPFLGPRGEDWDERNFELKLPSASKVPLMVRRRHLLAAPLEQGLHEPPFTDAWGTLKRQGPLHTRAWCFQESHLANRILYYAPGCIIFECRTHRRSEDQLPPYPQTFSDVLGQVDDGEKWRLLVRSYTFRQLTYANDKLAAVAGIATLMPQAVRSGYLAGLWHESLLVDLLWHIMPDTSRPVLTYPPEKGQPVTAPTWSWASLNRAVVWDHFTRVEPLMEVLETNCTPHSEANPFGQVEIGVLRLKGRVRRCKIFWKADQASYRAYFVRSDGSKSSEQHFIGDGSLVAQSRPAGKEAGSPKYAVRAVHGENKLDGELDAMFFAVAQTPLDNKCLVGLLVTPSMKIEGMWERIGMIVRLGKEWFTSGTEETIELI